MNKFWDRSKFKIQTLFQILDVKMMKNMFRLLKFENNQYPKLYKRNQKKKKNANETSNVQANAN